MGKPIAPAKGIAFAFPDVCKTPAPPAPPVPIPYPNIAQLGSAVQTTISAKPGEELLVAGTHVVLLDTEVPTTSGDEAGTVGGVKSNVNMQKTRVVQASSSVLYGGKGIARFGDQTEQNIGSVGNAFGQVLSAEPTVLVGD